jgi:hypothetical protein
MSVAIYRARVGFQDNRSGHILRPNHSLAFAHPEIIMKSIQNELQKGRVKQISSLPPDLFCSSIGLVPKQANGIQSGWIIIFNLSSLEVASVNDGIPKE